MADTFRLTANGIPFTAANQSMLAIHNADSSAIVKVYRVVILNSQTTAWTGGQNILTVNRYTGATITAGNWTYTPRAYDTNNAAWNTNITCAAKMTIGTPSTTEIFIRHSWSNDEPAVATGSIDEFETVTPYCTVLDYAFFDSYIEPIYIRNTQTLSIQNIGFTATAPAHAGLLDILIEFTVS